MERIKEAAKVLKLYPKLQLGERREDGKNAKGEPKFVVFPTGPHTVKLLAEPTTVMLNKGGKMVKGFKFMVEENGATYKWNVPLMNENGEGHYLIDRLNSMDVQVGEEITLEMKKRGPRNYIDVTRPGDAEHEVEEEEVPEDESLDAVFDSIPERPKNGYIPGTSVAYPDGPEGGPTF